MQPPYDSRFAAFLGAIEMVPGPHIPWDLRQFVSTLRQPS